MPLSIKHEASVLTSSRGGRRSFLDHTEMPLGADYRLGGVRGGFHWPLTCSAGEVQQREGGGSGSSRQRGKRDEAFRISRIGSGSILLCVICAHQEKMEAVLVVAGSKLQAASGSSAVLEWSVQ